MSGDEREHTWITEDIPKEVACPFAYLISRDPNYRLYVTDNDYGVTQGFFVKATCTRLMHSLANHSQACECHRVYALEAESYTQSQVDAVTLFTYRYLTENDHGHAVEVSEDLPEDSACPSDYLYKA